jgi:hypothetical protein
MPLVRVSERLFDALVGLANRNWRARRAELVAALPLILFSTLVGIVPLAYGGPPDPSWIPGIYDDADYDDAARLVIDEAGASSGQRPGRFAESPAACLLLRSPSQIPSGVRSAEMNRGPPRTAAITIVFAPSRDRLEFSPPSGVQRHDSPTASHAFPYIVSV